MTEQALQFLEYAFLALLYIFFLRVVRAVWAELREPKAVPADLAPTGLAEPTKRLSAEAPRAGKSRNLPQRLAVVGPDRSAATSFPLAQQMTIGRSDGCTVPLPKDNFVSHVHARVFFQDNEYWVEDLGSTNGTLVNGKKVTTPVPLRRGDRLQVGRTVLELQK
ncbi:MAG: FHA domain-containing protein [Acidimicrobiales bacterium]